MGAKDRKDIHNSQIPLVCQACEARHGGVCGVLTPDQLVELSSYTKRTAYQAGVQLGEVALESDRYANIMGGVVKLTKIMPDGRQQIVGLQFAPDFLGRPLAKDTQLIAESSTDTRLCSFPKKVVEKMIRDVPEMEHVLYAQTVKELDEARDWMMALGRKNATEKVASFLLMILRHAEPEREAIDYPIIIELPLKRADIADFLGLTIETVSRQLTNLRKKGIIDVQDRKHVAINAHAALLMAAGEM